MIVLAACGDDDRIIVKPGDGFPPAPPQGAFTVTGDRAVHIYWYANTERDLAGYRIYRNREPEGYYDLVAEVGAAATSFVDRDVSNGVTYYYGVTAFDDEGLESDFNPELLFDTPRPEGTITLWNVEARPSACAYDFSSGARVAWDDPGADILYEFTTAGGFRIRVVNEGHTVPTDIQDAGFVDPDVIDWAPEEGWSANGWVEAIAGHTYIVWTRDNHFAKIFVVEMSDEVIDLYWAYQLDPGNFELRVRPDPGPAP